MSGKRKRETDVRIIAEPGKQVTWKEFKVQYPGPAISLDGHCKAQTLFSKDKLHINLNHHGKREHDSTAVLATCAQALRLVRDGHLYLKFCRNGRPYAHVYINDCDQDVCLATFILLRPSLVNRPKLRLLVELEERLDSTAGLYVPDKKQAEMLGEVAWIFEPYAEARTSGELYRAKPADMLRIIDKVHRRIHAYLFGRQKKVKVDRKFEDLVQPRPKTYAVVREIGVFARLKMAEESIRAYAVLKAEYGGMYHWSLGKKSPFVDFPLGDIYDACNRIEGIPVDAIDRWGGSSNRGGSPRDRGSRLTPEQLAEVIDGCLAARA
ncbi:MAG: hypothetical protein U9Q03_00465 [Patescibacteria group bacterium]|nr:hypothetical protein [Patescibacteria group bacterium]